MTATAPRAAPTRKSSGGNGGKSTEGPPSDPHATPSHWPVARFDKFVDRIRTVPGSAKPLAGIDSRAAREHAAGRPSHRKRRSLMRLFRADFPPFRTAVVADAKIFCASRGERFTFTSKFDLALRMLWLMWSSDAYFSLVCYRAKASLQAKGIPVLPRLFHRLAMSVGQVCIGDPVIISPGLYLPHGQVVIDGIVRIDENVTIRPWVTIGLKEGVVQGATIGRGVRIGTGAKIIGPVQIGRGAVIGANAVVVHDVPKGATAVGVPARVRPAAP